MNKFSFAIIKELERYFDENASYSIETKIEELFCDNFGEFSWVECMVNLELIYGFDIPDELGGETNLTILEFGSQLASLPLIKENLYPDFFEIKNAMMQNILRLGLIEGGHEKGTQQEIFELKNLLNELEKRRNKIIRESMS